jgi:glycerol uptake facilitator-like aquaporin
MTLVLGRVADVHLNPVVTLGLWTLRRIDTMRAVVNIVIQFLGGLVAWTLSEYLLNAPLKNIANANFDWRVLTAEAVGALVFTFGVAAALYEGYRGLKYAVTVGGSLALGVMLASFSSNALLNPAVALGVQSWSFAYLAGPLLGALVGMNLYAMLFAVPTRVTATPVKAAARTTAARSTAKKPARKKATRK